MCVHIVYLLARGHPQQAATLRRLARIENYLLQYMCIPTAAVISVALPLLLQAWLKRESSTTGTETWSSASAL